jgi:hypothetical protein
VVVAVEQQQVAVEQEVTDHLLLANLQDEIALQKLFYNLLDQLHMLFQ